MEKKTAKKIHKTRKAEKPETAAEKVAVEKVVKKPGIGRGKYIFAVGRRKTAVARVKLYAEGDGTIVVNERQFENYFPTFHLQKCATDALSVTGFLKKVDVHATAQGGGVNAQAEALRLGVARALVKMDSALKTVLKKQGFITRDARKKERKKPGLKRARRAPQWQKR